MQQIHNKAPQKRYLALDSSASTFLSPQIRGLLPKGTLMDLEILIYLCIVQLSGET